MFDISITKSMSQPSRKPVQKDGRQAGASSTSSLSSSRTKSQASSSAEITEKDYLSLAKKYSKLKEEIEVRRKNNEHLMTQLETLASKYEKLKEDHVSLRTDNTRFQNEVRILQARSFRSLEDAHWMPMDASEIATKIYSLRKGIDTIAKSYATVEIQQTISQLSPEGLLGLKSDLACVASFKSDSSNEAKELMESRDSPRLCLAALVSYAVHKRVLQNPFFFAGTWLERDFKPPSFKEGEVHIHPDAATFLYEGWLGGCAYDAEKANTWRSDTLRFWNPRFDEHAKMEATHEEQERNDLARTQVSMLVELINESCLSQATKCIKDIPSILLRTMESATHAQFESEVVSVFQEAGQLSLRLWVQRPWVQCRFLKDLAKAPFDITADIMKAHAVHRIDDPEDHRFDGKQIKVVVHPAVVAAGTHEAEHYDTHTQVWAPAVVWLDAT